MSVDFLIDTYSVVGSALSLFITMRVLGKTNLSILNELLGFPVFLISTALPSSWKETIPNESLPLSSPRTMIDRIFCSIDVSSCSVRTLSNRMHPAMLHIDYHSNQFQA